MSTYVLIHGAGSESWYWHRVIPLLEEAGHRAVAVDLPADDDDAGLEDYADRVVKAIDKRKAVVVAHSLGAFTAPLVCARVPVEALVFVNAMIPVPGEKASEWGDHTKSKEARTEAAQRGGYSTEFDIATYFLHDLPKDLAEESGKHEREEAEAAFSEPCRFERWPEVPTHVIVGKDDRLFPADFQARVARERLGQTVEAIPGGHLVALANPHGLADKLLGYARALQ